LYQKNRDHHRSDDRPVLAPNLLGPAGDRFRDDRGHRPCRRAGFGGKAWQQSGDAAQPPVFGADVSLTTISVGVLDDAER